IAAGVFVVRSPGALKRLDRRVEAVDHRRWCVPGLERRGIDERLERGTWLTACLRRAIEAAGGEVAAANHGADMAGVRIERNQRRLQHVAGVYRRRLGA